jgi:hypothetical protein
MVGDIPQDDRRATEVIRRVRSLLKKAPPHVAARKAHQRLLEFSFATPKRLLQQYRPKGDVTPLLDDHGSTLPLALAKPCQSRCVGTV